ncbi:hypothetical protein [Actinoplanes sp. L3-i22]|uniref:hypothetical protein n=1 Tax=Actinoplanes sp. L3-i22 TaxID=2836373 RepID=UPI001C761AA7|nr:hypothetical protein [Actinoplanes sp. L3-i22]BCY10939.1 hypothetical protein L3i22_060270 [Actinoplanes sp. L3-i22]
MTVEPTGDSQPQTRGPDWRRLTSVALGLLTGQLAVLAILRHFGLPPILGTAASTLMSVASVVALRRQYHRPPVPRRPLAAKSWRMSYGESWVTSAPDRGTDLVQPAGGSGWAVWNLETALRRTSGLGFTIAALGVLGVGAVLAVGQAVSGIANLVTWELGTAALTAATACALIAIGRARSRALTAGLPLDDTAPPAIFTHMLPTCQHEAGQVAEALRALEAEMFGSEEHQDSASDWLFSDGRRTASTSGGVPGGPEFDSTTILPVCHQTFRLLLALGQTFDPENSDDQLTGAGHAEQLAAYRQDLAEITELLTTITATLASRRVTSASADEPVRAGTRHRPPSAIGATAPGQATIAEIQRLTELVLHS